MSLHKIVYKILQKKFPKKFSEMSKVSYEMNPYFEMDIESKFKSNFKEVIKEEQDERKMFYIPCECNTYFQLFLTAHCNLPFSDKLKISLIYDEETINEINDIFSKETFDVGQISTIINNTQDKIVYPRRIIFVNLDIEENYSEKMNETLKFSSFLSNPIAFYSKGISSEFKPPSKVLIQPKFSLKNKKLSKRLSKQISQRCKNYFNLSFILGSKSKIPTLILFTNNTIVKICNNKLLLLDDINDLSKIFDEIYIYYYNVN